MCWRDTVATLAGPRARLSEGVDQEWEGIVARVKLPWAMLGASGIDPEDAWRNVALELGRMRAVQELENSDWTDVDEVVDQVSFVVARDPDGRVWGIVVVPVGNDPAGDTDRWVAVDERPEWVAQVEPLETRDWESLRSAIARRGHPLHRD